MKVLFPVLVLLVLAAVFVPFAGNAVAAIKTDPIGSLQTAIDPATSVAYEPYSQPVAHRFN